MLSGADEVCTFWVVLHGILQILHDPLLPNHLLDSGLSLDIKGVRVQTLNLPLTLLALPPLPVKVCVEELGKALRVLERGG